MYGGKDELMSELERFELCRRLPRFSCGSLVSIASNITEAYLADVQGLWQRYDTTQRNYASLPPNVRAVADILLPWMLRLRLRYGAECTAMMLHCYPRMSAQSRQEGLQQSN
jgi:hypothetical protein